jgi:hypothetical protein
MLLLLNIIFTKNLNYHWGLGIGDWGLGIGDWAQSPIPNPQSPGKLFCAFPIFIKFIN